MANPDISGYGGLGAQNPSASGIGASSEVQGTSAPASSQLYTSTIEKSVLEELVALLAAGLPVLLPPSANAADFKDLTAGVASGVTSIAMKMEQTKNDIINSMWDTFLKGVRELEKRAKERDIERWEDPGKGGPMSATDYYAYLTTLSASQRANEVSGGDSSLVASVNTTFNNWMVSPIQANATTTDPIASNNYPSAAFIAGSVVSGGNVIQDFSAASISPLADALVATGANSGLPMDTQAAAAMIAALLNNGAVNKAASDAIAGAAANGQPPRDLDFALNYAKTIKAIVTANLEGGHALSPEQQGQNQMIRLMLSVMALNLLYRAAYGGMTQEEFQAVYDGNTEGIPEQIKEQVEQLVSFIKGFLPTDPGRRSATLTQIKEYIDSKDSVDSMLSTTRLFSSLLGTDDISNNRLASTR